MLEQKDLEAIAQLIEERAQKTETLLLGRIDETETKLTGRIDETEIKLTGRIDETETKLSDRIEQRAQQTESFLLDELARTQDYLGAQIESVRKKQEEMYQFYRLDRLDNDNLTLLLRLVESMQKRLDEIENKIA